MEPLSAMSVAADQGQIAVLVTVVAVAGQPPSRPGAKVAVVDGSIVAGTLGCSEFDLAAITLAARMVAADAETELADIAEHQPQRVQVFAEIQRPAARVLVTGDNPIAATLAELASAIGRHGVRLAEADPVTALAAVSPGITDAVVVCDHDAPYAADLVEAALRGTAGFVGMLGTRRHLPAVVTTLSARGVPVDVLSALHTPCGLDIGSRGPGEIALSVLAEVVASGAGRPGGSMRIDWLGSQPTG